MLKNSIIFLLFVLALYFLLLNTACKKENDNPQTSEDTLIYIGSGVKPSYSKDGSKIAYITSDSLMVCNEDGTGTKLLTTGVTGTFSWSHSGNYLLIMKPNLGWYDIWRIKADGSDAKKLTNGDTYSFVATWSPDDSKIAFISISGPADIYVMNADGSGSVKLSNLGNCSPIDPPQWSSDGTKILFSAGWDFDRDLYTIHPDGSGLTRLEVANTWEEMGQFAPDGSRVYFGGSTDNGAYVYSCKPDGTDLINLTSNSPTNHYPCLSPDGAWIVYNSWQQSISGLYLMSSSGANPRMILKDYSDPVEWSPDSKRIIYVLYANSQYKIYSKLVFPE
jgi:Tol biopolymer transport system component